MTPLLAYAHGGDLASACWFLTIPFAAAVTRWVRR